MNEGYCYYSRLIMIIGVGKTFVAVSTSLTINVADYSYLLNSAKLVYYLKKVSNRFETSLFSTITLDTILEL